MSDLLTLPQVPKNAIWERRGHYCGHCGYGEWWSIMGFVIRKKGEIWELTYNGRQVGENESLEHCMRLVSE